MAGMMKTIGNAMKNIGKTGIKGDYGAAAFKGAGVGAAIGGVQALASGGSFMEGAGSGAINGALIGAGARAYKVGALGQNWSKARGMKGFGTATSRYKSKINIAKGLNAKNAKVAAAVTKT